jgi:hypothetical protein
MVDLYHARNPKHTALHGWTSEGTAKIRAFLGWITFGLGSGLVKDRDGIASIQPFSAGVCSIQAITDGIATIKVFSEGRAMIHES